MQSINHKSAKKTTLLVIAAFIAAQGFAQQKKPLSLDNNPNAIKVPLGKNDPNDNATRATGTITDALTGKPLAGARLTVPEFSAAITDDKGNYSIKVPSYNTSVFVAADGYQAKEIALKGRKAVNSALFEESFTSMYDVVNLPYATKAANQTAYAVSSVNTQGNWGVVSETPDSYLQGKVAGVNAVRRSGTPAVGANLFLRGFSSILGSNQPLVVVDGMIYDVTDYGFSVIGNHNNNILQHIDPKDIENITILKDASSMYGTKGANGVILITTNHAKEFATRIDAAAYSGINVAPSNYPVMNKEDYRTYLSDVLASKGLTPDQIAALPYMNDDKTNPNYFRFHDNTDWQREIFKTTVLNNYFLKVSGGDNVAKYALTMGFLKNPSVIQNTDLTRYNTRFNADLNLTKKLSATTNLSFTYNEQKLSNQGLDIKTNPLAISLVKAPFLPINEISDAGVKSPNLADKDTLNISNPVALIRNAQAISKNYRFFGNIGFKYQLSKDIEISSTIAITYDKIRENEFIPRKGVVNDTLQSAEADSRLSSQVKRFYSINTDTRINYNKRFDRINEINLRAGFRYLSAESEIDYLYGYNSATDNFVSVGTGVNLLRQTGGELGKWRWVNMYTGMDYSRSNRYFLSINVALDGSSRFGKSLAPSLQPVELSNKMYALMPSAAAAWLISSEKFMAKANWIEVLKLRFSYSLTGNDDIGNYNNRQYYVSQNYQGIQGLVRGNAANTAIQWENNHKMNLGIDAALFNERLSISADVYENKTYDMLVREEAPVASGVGSMMVNSASMRTRGFDIAVNARLVAGKNFKWDFGVNLTSYKNKITKLNNTFYSSYAGATIITAKGQAANLFYGYKTNGILTNSQEATTAGLKVVSPTGNELSFTAGDVRFADLNGDKYIDENDRTVIGDPTPDFTGGISNRLTYKNWSLDALFTFSQGNDVYNYTRAQLEGMNNGFNQTQAIINRWRNNNQSTSIPKATWGDPLGNSRFSDRWIEDGSYFRLRTVTLSHQIKIKPGTVKYVNVYVTGNNLFTLTKYKGFDPEFSAVPGILGQGVDVSLEPQFVSAQLGVRIGL